MKELIPQYRLMLVRESEIKYDHAVSSVRDVVDLMLKMGFADSPEEHVYMFCLDCRGTVIAMHEISHGGLSSAYISIRSIFCRGLINNAAAIIMAHNHPSGDPTPSEDDVAATRKIKSAGDLMEIQLLDHIILGSGCYCSLKEDGYIHKKDVLF